MAFWVTGGCQYAPKVGENGLDSILPDSWCFAVFKYKVMVDFRSIGHTSACNPLLPIGKGLP